MITPTVRVLTDLKNLVWHEVSLDEVPRGYVKTHMIDHGEFYVDPKQLKPTTDPRFPPFSEEVRDILRAQHAIVGGPMNMTLDEWEHGFRCDTTPWGEIAHWQVVVEACRRFTSHLTADDESSREKRHDVFRVVNALMSYGPAGAGAKYTAQGTITAKRVGEVAEWVFSPDRNADRLAARRLLRRLIKPDRVFGPSRVPLSALLDAHMTGPNLDAGFDPRDLIDEADVILAVDVDSEEERVVFGPETLESYAGSVVLRVEIDADTDEADTLAVIVSTIKGL